MMEQIELELNCFDDDLDKGLHLQNARKCRKDSIYSYIFRSTLRQC